MKILVADDHEMNRKLIRDILAFHGYEVIEAKNGEECVEKAKGHLPAFIFLDIQMPVMDGYTALKILKDTPETKNIKVIALTSFAMTGDREKIMQAGFDDYVSKPIDTRQLPHLVKKWLGEK